MKAKMRQFVLLLSLLSVCTTAAAQQILYTASLESNPADAQTMVLRERGKKGLFYHFKYQDGGNFDSNAAFPLNLAMATVTVQIGLSAPITCTGGAPAATLATSHALLSWSTTMTVAATPTKMPHRARPPAAGTA